MDFELEPRNSAVFEGVLNDVPVGRLEGNEERRFPFGVCFLTAGRFVLSAELRRVDLSPEVHIARTYITALVADG
jgi:hypothetical protein